MVALPTVRNTAAYDVIVVTPDGRKHANIQVKTTHKPRATFFLMPPSVDVRSGPHDFYVLLRWNPENMRYDGFMLTGATARHEVRRVERFQRRRIRQGHRQALRQSIIVSGRRASRDVAQWSTTWLNWAL